MNDNTLKKESRLAQAITDLSNIETDYHNKINVPLMEMKAELVRIFQLYSTEPYKPLTDEYLKAMGFDGNGWSTKLMSEIGYYYSRHNVVVFVDPNSNSGDTFRYKIGVTEQRNNTTHVAMFRWITTQADLHDMYFAIRNETLSPSDELPF
jgi:hypothetical protein